MATAPNQAGSTPTAPVTPNATKQAAQKYKPQGHNYRFRVDGKILEVGDDGFYHPKTEAEISELKWQASKGLVFLAEV